MGSDRQVLIAGAGIAGMAAAIDFATRGFAVRLFEQAPRMEAVGAGIQLSPNATRILRKLGVLDLLLPAATRPEAVVLKDAATLRELARVPLGQTAERRWRAPYLVIHRSDLQEALLERAAQEPGIELTTGTTVYAFAVDSGGVTVSAEMDSRQVEAKGQLLIGADGVWSKVRRQTSPSSTRSRFSGELAWRATVDATSPTGRTFAAAGSLDCVTAFLHPGFHLVAYPVRGGATINLAAFTKGERIAENWSGKADPALLARAMRGTAQALIQLAEQAGSWTAWPIHTVDSNQPWTADRIALIGDAAHAMTPFAAQGAAMAIEDAATLAASIPTAPADLAGALAAWEKSRRPRVVRVVRRGALNRLAWHAAGPLALARNLFLMARSPERLAADLDWLYGWRF